ncbi:unnamed protein product [Bemisia tabaci]|uniref:BAG family molecular chaperone regulator 2 n=1 Tax=Bemisia tabaci TaxID=7038 RepID=A0A9N9ZYN1_BEMTA|nr:PREDICTED: BAG family molecular chaperone regulator 2 [Bemisia tabaci]CAH0382074.1 unnamed protein product [Bemisia tabaci]
MENIVTDTALQHIVDENLEDSIQPPKDRLFGILDKLEMHVEKMRREALMIEEEKDNLFSTLDAVKNSELLVSLEESDKDDIQRFIDRIFSRCMTVDVAVHTHRDNIQEDALYQVNNLIDSLVINLQMDPKSSKNRCLSYMAACSSAPIGISDNDFESAILGCTIDDQKRIKKRLQGLLDYINTALAVSVRDFD